MAVVYQFPYTVYSVQQTSYTVLHLTSRQNRDGAMTVSKSNSYLFIAARSSI